MAGRLPRFWHADRTFGDIDHKHITPRRFALIVFVYSFLGDWFNFFLFAGMIMTFVFNSVISLSAYWNDRILEGIDSWYPFYFYTGSILNFLIYEQINQCMSFKQQIFGIPIFIALMFYALVFMGEYMEKCHLKTGVFLLIIFLLGFINNIQMTTLGRFCMNFRQRDISTYVSGTAIIGILSAVIGFV